MGMSLFDFAVITIFARETLEGGIIIGEYRTVILRSDWQHHQLTQQEALRAVTVAALAAGALALLVCAAVAIPLAVLSKDFNDHTAIIIEGASKIVAAICILGLSLKMPKFFGLYRSKKDTNEKEDGTSNEASGESDVPECSNDLSLRSIRFNVAWNIWREVAECGVFLIPFFLSGDGVLAIPLSALVGILVGAVVCLGIYYANQHLSKPLGLTIFTVSLLMLLSTGLFSGGCHKFEMAYSSTPVVWTLKGDFWSVDRLPMTIFKPFGYRDKRTVLQMVCFWGWLIFGLVLHNRKWRRCRYLGDEVATETSDQSPTPVSPNLSKSSSDAGVDDLADIEVAFDEGLNIVDVNR